MGHSERELREIRRVDLLTYLCLRCPDQLVRLSGGTYCTREHDSLKISNGKWYWFSRGVGGRSALDYLVTVRGLTLPQAMEEVETCLPPPAPRHTEKREQRKLEIPETVPEPDIVRAYLKGRGIGEEIIEYCVREGILLETAENHEALFLGRDATGKPRCASLRSTDGDFRGEARGSSKRYPFRITPTGAAKVLHVFESAIDLMSLATMEDLRGEDWREDAWLSLSGVGISRSGETLPRALAQFLSDNPSVREIRLHLDNDPAGRRATDEIQRALAGSGLTVVDEPPVYPYKDVNEQLQYMEAERVRRKEEEQER